MMAVPIFAIPDWLLSFRPPREAAIGFALIGLYYLIVWLAVGSDPVPGTIVVRYEPPNGLSPATLRYLVKKGFDEKGFTAAILNLAAKHFAEIEPQAETYRLNQGTADSSVLSLEEKALTDVLMGRGFTVDLNEQNRRCIYLAIRAMSHALDLEVTKTYLRLNRNYLLPGAIASVILLLVMITQQDWAAPSTVLFLTFFTSVWTLLTPLMVLYLIHVWRGVNWGGGPSGISKARALNLTLFSMPFAVVNIGVFVWLALVSAPWFAALFIFLAGLSFFMYSALKAPTATGRKLLDDIEGFRMFLAGTETDRLKREDARQVTPELFELFLPYAFALDVHAKWVQRIDDISIANVGAAFVDNENGSAAKTLDLTTFGLFVQRWFPFDISTSSDIKLSIGPINED
jgi:hypothetical protein